MFTIALPSHVRSRLPGYACPPPPSFRSRGAENYGKVKLVLKDNKFFLETGDAAVLDTLLQDDTIRDAVVEPGDGEAGAAMRECARARVCVWWEWRELWDRLVWCWLLTSSDGGVWHPQCWCSRSSSHLRLAQPWQR